MEIKKINIRKFEDFINESSKTLQRFYMLVKNPFPMDSENLLGKMIGQTRNELFDQIKVDKSNHDELVIQKDVPVLNFTEDNDLVEDMIDKGLIDKATLYNDPSESQLVSDKVSFHQVFKNSKFVPKTVFYTEDIEKLKFPIIAKPANGKSAEGIKKFDKLEDFKDSKEEFDVFSELIDIQKEFRCFCFKDEIIELNERVKVEGADDFLKKTSTKTDFFYKDVNPLNYSHKKELKELIEECKSLVQLDFFSIDFAEDSEGKLHLIEMNSRTGMGADKMAKLYSLVYEDFYKKKPEKFTSDKLDSTMKDWEKAYAEEKGSRIDECTTVAGKLNDVSFLFKNRDRSYTPNSVIIREKVAGVEIVYYTDQTGWIEGMNEFGVGFVFTAMTDKTYKGYKPSYYVTDEPKNDTRFKKFEDGIKKSLTGKTAKLMMDLVIKSGKSGSFILGDTVEMFELEVFNGKNKSRKLDVSDMYIKTNHGMLFPEAGHQPDGESIKRSSTTIRKHQAYTQLMGTTSINEIPTRMKFQAFDSKSPLNTFRTDDEEHTISQCLMDLTNKRFYFFHDKLTAGTLKIKENFNKGKIEIHSTVIDSRNGN